MSQLRRRSSSYDCNVPDLLADSVPTVLLRHELPDGSWHVDWMIANDPAGAGPLLTFRPAGLIHELEAGQSIEAEQLPDHRSAYLEYEGELSGGRGRVTRAARGRAIRQLGWDGDALTLTVHWQGGEHPGVVQELCATRVRGRLWNVECQRRVIEVPSQ
jgi:hypothetical protein